MARSLQTPSARSLSAVLFLCVLAAQLGLIATSPVLAQVAGDLHVSTAAAGQLRTVAGLAAALTALALPLANRRLGLRRILSGGAGLLALGAVASAAAPTFGLLALAQAPVGAGGALLVAGATAATAEWAPPDARPRVLSSALIGNPAGWIVGMPLIGLLGETSWRYGFLALPLPAALAAAAGAARTPRASVSPGPAGGLREALADGDLRRWLLSELVANSAWLGLLVYAGALFTDSYGTSSGTTGVLLASSAAAFVVGNLAFRRAAGADARTALVRLALALAVLVALFGLVRPAPAVSAALLASSAFLGGARTLLGNAHGLRSAPEHRLAAMAARAAANQFGSFAGAAIAGTALAVFGYAGLGLVLALLFVAAAAVLMPPRRRPAASAGRRPRTAAPARAR